MNSWKSLLNADPTDWLLEEDNPSVRYLTLVDILERPADDPDVVKARRDIKDKGIVPQILAKQEEGGYWENTLNAHDAANPAAAVDIPQGWPYDKFEMCWGRHTCHMGVVKALKALSEIPPGKMSPEVQHTIKEGTEYLLKHHIHKRSHNLTKVSKPVWLRFGFPLMYGTDILEILGVLTKLGCRDERMQEAIDVVVSKQDPNGTWKLASTFNGRFQVDIEEKGKPSKWITLSALRVLKEFNRL